MLERVETSRQEFSGTNVGFEQVVGDGIGKEGERDGEGSIRVLVCDAVVRWHSRRDCIGMKQPFLFQLQLPSVEAS